MIRIIRHEEGGRRVLCLHRGRTLCLGEWRFHDHSDSFAVVWDLEARCLKAVRYATTLFPTHGNTAEADAEPETVALARKWLFAWALRSWRRWNTSQAMRVEKDKLVQVCKGAKLPDGVLGTVFWVGLDMLGREKAGIVLEDRTRVFTLLSNVEVVEVRQYLLPQAAGRREAFEIAKQGRWLLPFPAPGQEGVEVGSPPPPLPCGGGEAYGATQQTIPEPHAAGQWRC